MKYIENKLGRQLILLIIVVLDIILFMFLILLPKVLSPIYEENIYNSLKIQIELIDEDIHNLEVKNNIAYLYIADGKLMASKNINKVILLDKEKILKLATSTFGKFQDKEKNTYYYYSDKQENTHRIAIANKKAYTLTTRQNITNVIIPIILITFTLISLIVFFWSMLVVKKIEKLKMKIDNIDNDNFNHKIEFKTDDEIKSLADAVEDMRISLKNQEKYKNQMYQNISHDFKTPLTVIKSYIEAVEDGVETEENALKVINDQVEKLEKKVHSLLYLNKLDYLKDQVQEKLTEVNIKKIIENSIEKFKYQNKNITFETIIDEKSKFFGTVDLWETIIDNVLNNFMRYAEKEIKITVKNGKMILYNDGPKIDENLIDCIFNPYRKGIKGQYGLGLSIVKKTLNLLSYDIAIKNNRKGVSFIIKKTIKNS